MAPHRYNGTSDGHLSGYPNFCEAPLRRGSTKLLDRTCERAKRSPTEAEVCE